mgnify:CR=1 FL=1
MQNITKKKKWIGICCVLIVLILIWAGRLVYLHFLAQKNGTPSYSSQAVDWDGSFKTEGKEGYITVPGYETVSLQEGKDTAKIVLANPDTNQCLFQFQLILSDTEEVLYTSDMVKPGKAITCSSYLHTNRCTCRKETRRTGWICIMEDNRKCNDRFRTQSEL